MFGNIIDKLKGRFKLRIDPSGIRIAVISLIIVVSGIVYSLFLLFSGEESSDSAVYDNRTKGLDTYTSESITDAAAQTEAATVHRELIYVYICGEIVNPGVYELEADSRVYELVAMAGGVTNQADINKLNMADRMSDGDKVYIPSVLDDDYAVAEVSDGRPAKININTAGVSELTTLPGIGESRANDIISYRKNNGGFKAIEDIMKVSGIKEAGFNKIKDYIKV